MRWSPQKFAPWTGIALWGFLLLVPGCITRLSVDQSSPLAIELKNYQPLAVLPIQDAPGYRHSGSSLQQTTEEFLQEKHYTLVAQERVIQTLAELKQTAQSVSSDPARIAQFSEAIGSKILVVGTFLSYRVQKSYISPDTSEVWPGTASAPAYMTLPTYHQGSCEMRVRLQMLESRKGTVIWMAEGTGRGPSGTEEKILSRLIEDLLKDLPPLPAKSE